MNDMNIAYTYLSREGIRQLLSTWVRGILGLDFDEVLESIDTSYRSTSIEID